MDKAKILEAVKQARSQGDKKKFVQSIDLAINFKELDVKKVTDKVEEFVPLPHGRGTPAKICALVGGELKSQAEKLADLTILDADFSKWSDKRKAKTLARKYDFFIAQANFMPDIAKTFGRYFGTIGKMPNPKNQEIVPPKANIEPLVKKLQTTVKVVAKKAPVAQCVVGNESMTDEQIAENIEFLLDRVRSKLPKKEHNFASIVIKKTMGKAVKVKYERQK